MRLTTKTTSTLLLLASFFVGHPALAQWTPGGYNTGVGLPISDGSGGLITTGATDGLGTTVTKRTAAAGAVQWNMKAKVGPVFDFEPPSTAAPDRSGGVVLAGSANIGDIYADRLNSAGARPWATATTVCNAANPQNQPNIATDAAGNSYIVWHDER